MSIIEGMSLTMGVVNLVLFVLAGIGLIIMDTKPLSRIEMAVTGIFWGALLINSILFCLNVFV